MASFNRLINSFILTMIISIIVIMIMIQQNDKISYLVNAGTIFSALMNAPAPSYFTHPIGNNYKITWTGFEPPFKFDIKIAIPGIYPDVSFFDNTWKPSVKQMFFEVDGVQSTSYTIANPRLVQNPFSPTDQLQGYTWTFSITDHISPATSTSTYTTWIPIITPFTLPCVVMFSAGGTVHQLSYHTLPFHHPPTPSPTTWIPHMSAFSPYAVRSSDGSSIDIYLNGLLAHANEQLSGTLRFYINSNPLATDMTRTFFALNVDRSLAPVPITMPCDVNYICLLNQPLPAGTNTILVKVVATTSINSIKLGAGPRAGFDGSSLNSVLITDFPIDSAPYTSSTFKLDSVTLIPTGYNLIPLTTSTHREMEFKWSVKQYQTTGVQIVQLPVPMLYRIDMFIIHCSTSGTSVTGASTTFNIPAVAMRNVDITLQIDVNARAIITCRVAFSSFAPLLKGPISDLYGHLNLPMKTYSASSLTVNQYQGMRPYVYGTTDGISTIPALSDLNQFISIEAIPFQYGLIDRSSSPSSSSIAKWKLEIKLPGVYALIIPTIQIKLNIESPIVTFAAKKQVWGWSMNNDPTTSTLINPTTLTELFETSRDQITFGMRSPSTISSLVSPHYTFDISFVPTIIPSIIPSSNNNFKDDFLYGIATQVYQKGIINIDYHYNHIDYPLELPPAHLPSYILSHTGVNKIQSFPPHQEQLTFSTTISVSLSSLPFNYPTEPIDLSTYPPNSIWLTQPDVVIYPGTTISVTITLVGGTFAANALVQGSGFVWAVRPVITLSSDSVTFTVDYLLMEKTTLSSNSKIAELITGDIVITSDSTKIEFILSSVSISLSTETIPPPVNYNPSTTITIPIDYITFGYGVTSIGFLSPSGVGNNRVNIPRLIDNGNHQMTQKPIIYTTDTPKLFISFTTSDPYLTRMKLELYKRVNQNDVFIQVISNEVKSVEEKIQMISLNGETLKNVFFRLTYYVSDSNLIPSTYIQDTIYFDLKSTCIKESIVAIGGLIDDCPKVDEICVLFTGICQPIPTKDPSPITQKCPRCNPDNTSSCIPANILINQLEQCNCKDGWVGAYCQQSILCDPKKTKCNPDNGYVLPLPNSSQCDSTCRCYNGWAGLSCQSCELQCFNDGIRYNDCARCGCNEGYIGSQCECSSVRGKIIIPRSNNIMMTTLGQLSVMKSNEIITNNNNNIQLYEYNQNSEAIGLIDGYTPDDLQLFFMLKSFFNSFRVDLTTTSTGKFTFSINALSITLESPKTEFIFTIPYNCEQYNPDIKSNEQLKTIWGAFVDNFIGNEIVRAYFPFEDDETPPITTELTPTPESFPPEGEEYRNGTCYFGNLSMSSYLGLIGMIFLFMF